MNNNMVNSKKANKIQKLSFLHVAFLMPKFDIVCFELLIKLLNY